MGGAEQRLEDGLENKGQMTEGMEKENGELELEGAEQRLEDGVEKRPNDRGYGEGKGEVR